MAGGDFTQWIGQTLGLEPLAAASGRINPYLGGLEEMRQETLRLIDAVLDLPANAHLAINALQRAAAIVIQKSTREGFGLTVAEAMWKGKPVIGGATGYTVNSVEGCAFRLRYPLSNPPLLRRMGDVGLEHVRENFLITRHLRDYLSLLAHLSR